MLRNVGDARENAKVANTVFTTITDNNNYNNSNSV